MQCVSEFLRWRDSSPSGVHNTCREDWRDHHWFHHGCLQYEATLSVLPRMLPGEANPVFKRGAQLHEPGSCKAERAARESHLIGCRVALVPRIALALPLAQWRVKAA